MSRVALKPYRGVFGAEEARHLLTRTGFGASPQEIREAAAAGLSTAVDRCMKERPTDDSRYRLWQRRRQRLSRTALRGDMEAMQAGWLLAAVTSPCPLKDRLALFWHDHFATANSKVDDLVAMDRQMKLFVEHGTGGFRNLLGRVAKDPAMLVFLDGDKNSKSRPNENFAREVMELFTLGIGNYTERDIKEAARAFTGWQLLAGRFRWVPEAHDTGTKTVLSRRGRLSGEDVLDICCAQKVCAEFLAGKLAWLFLGQKLDGRELKALAGSLARHDLHIGRFLKELFASELFFDARFRRGRIKSPVEYVVGAMRALRARFSAIEAASLCGRMGQVLYDPPGVAGWPEGRAWINSTTIVARRNFAVETGRGRSGTLKVRHGLGDQTPTSEVAFALTGQRSESLAAADILSVASSCLTDPVSQLG